MINYNFYNHLLGIRIWLGSTELHVIKQGYIFQITFPLICNLQMWIMSQLKMDAFNHFIHFKNMIMDSRHCDCVYFLTAFLIIDLPWFMFFALNMGCILYWLFGSLLLSGPPWVNQGKERKQVPWLLVYIFSVQVMSICTGYLDGLCHNFNKVACSCITTLLLTPASSGQTV